MSGQKKNTSQELNFALYSKQVWCTRESLTDKEHRTVNLILHPARFYHHVDRFKIDPEHIERQDCLHLSQPKMNAFLHID